MSSTWSRTSTRSSTSDAAAPSRGRVAVLAGFVRLTHPFPSLLDGIVVAAIALIAGGEVGTAVALGVSMTALQGSIGTLNDIVDAPRDRGMKPGKPIPAASSLKGQGLTRRLGRANRGTVMLAKARALSVMPGMVNCKT